LRLARGFRRVRVGTGPLEVLTLLCQPPPGVGHHEQKGSVISGFGAAGSLLAGKRLVH
jgi:hypothetical protein